MTETERQAKINAIKKREQANPEEGLSHHEAGHAYIFIALLNKPFKQVTILPNSKFMGHVEHADPVFRFRDIKDVSDMVCALYAGLVAEGILYNADSGQISLNTYGNDDLEQALKCLPSNWTNDEKIYFINFCKSRVTRLLKERWPIVQQIAKELIARKTLSYNECKAVVIRMAEGNEAPGIDPN